MFYSTCPSLGEAFANFGLSCTFQMKSQRSSLSVVATKNAWLDNATGTILADLMAHQCSTKCKIKE